MFSTAETPDVGLDNQTPVAEGIGFGRDETRFAGSIQQVVIEYNNCGSIDHLDLPRFRGRVRAWVSSALQQLSPLVVDGGHVAEGGVAAVRKTHKAKTDTSHESKLHTSMFWRGSKEPRSMVYTQEKRRP